MSPERDEPIEDPDHELYEDVPPRSIFAATWFRVVLVVIVLGVVGAVAVPYVLDWMNPPPMSRTAATSPLAPEPLSSTPPSTTDTAVGDGPRGDERAADKQDATVIAAPAAPTTAMPAPARAETKSEPKPGASVPSAKPPAEPKAVAKAGPPQPKAEPRRAAASAEGKGQSAMAVTGDAARPAPKPPASRPAVAKAKATTPATVPATGGPYWVQIGAFKDPEAAKRVAAKLREENFKVEESVRRVGGTASAPAGSPAKTPSPPAATGADQYDVFVSGMSAAELNRRLAGKGLAAELSSSGVVVRPSLPLRDAVALSKDLAVEGFKVQVRRASAGASAPAVVSAPSPTPDSGGQALHRVRVGAFPDRAAAVAAARELESKGFKPYIARGDQ